MFLGRRTILSAIAALFLALGPTAAQDDVPVVAAASDLQFAVKEIAGAFEAETGWKVMLNFGSTGNFSRQIRQGAPFQIYMAADETYIQNLHADKLVKSEGDLYGLGRVVSVWDVA